MSEKLKPCPFCGANSASILGGSSVQVVCACMATGPESRTDKGAITAWDTRAPAWQDISTAPKDGTHILLSDGKRVTVGFWKEGKRELNGMYSFSGWKVFDDLEYLFDEATHWMPLPEPPTTQTGEE